ncbi:MAG: F0F1 ATP synthase subunit delta [Candidatus Nanopelagicaceae bacterium]
MTRELMEMGGTSRQAILAARSALDLALKGKSESDISKFASELFTALTALDSSAPLRRSITDISRDAKDKSKLVADVFGKSAPAAAGLIGELSAFKWSKPNDLVDTLEHLAVEAEASAANASGELDRLEEELFAFSRVVAGDSELRQALSSSAYSSEGKRVLVAKLFGGKVSQITGRMLGHLVSGSRGRSLETTIDFYIKATVARRNRMIAVVKTAIAITDQQREKLTATLAAKIGQPVRLNVEIDPSVIGGISIRFADELIDATIVNRLADASRALAG